MSPWSPKPLETSPNSMDQWSQSSVQALYWALCKAEASKCSQAGRNHTLSTGSLHGSLHALPGDCSQAVTKASWTRSEEKGLQEQVRKRERKVVLHLVPLSGSRTRRRRGKPWKCLPFWQKNDEGGLSLSPFFKLLFKDGIHLIGEGRAPAHQLANPGKKVLKQSQWR